MFLLKAKIKVMCLALSLILLAGGGYFYSRYKGLSHGLANQFRYATVSENKNLWFCISYWLEFMQKLSLNKQTGIYGFAGVGEEGLDDFAKGRLAYHQGNFAGAINDIERDIQRSGESETKLFWLAMSYMRHAEAENCLDKLLDDSPKAEDPRGLEQHAHHLQAQICALPLNRFHDRVQSALAAAKLFERLLDKYDQTNRLYQWLLNFNYMTVGGFPQQVPPRYLIRTGFIDSFYGQKKKTVESQFSYLAFADRAKELGVNLNNTGRGVAVEDFDKDGYLDMVTGGSFEYLVYYKNEHAGKFIDQTTEVGLGGVTQPFAITAADYDNDGWIDIFVSRPFGSYRLYRNNGVGPSGQLSFSDATSSIGILDGKPDDQITATWISSWADVNNDGKLDLFVAQWGFKLPFVRGLMAKPRMDSKLFINEHGRFVDKTIEYGLGSVVEDQYFIGSAFGDFDGDGYPDLFLSSPLKNVSVLLRNIEGRRFEKSPLVNRPEGGFSCAFVDVNHDGRLDIFQAGFADAKTSTEMAVFGEYLDQYHSGHSTILLQTADGHFEEHNDFFDMPMSTMGASFGDINNDGCNDFYLGTGDPEGWFILPNLMYLGQAEGTRCTGRLTNISMLQGFGTIQKGHGIVFFDFDNDGDQDIYSSLGGMWPADRWPNQFFVNNSLLENSWISIRLQGRQTNNFGAGAMIKVTAWNQKQEEIVRYYQMDNKTGFGSAPYLAQIGLMDANRIGAVEVYWPVSRCRKTYPAKLRELNTLDEAACF